MSLDLPSPLPDFDQRLLHVMERVVPCDEREEWSRAWQAELWHVRHVERGGRFAARDAMSDLSVGLICDAVWLRTESWRRMLSGTAALCLGTLCGLLLLSTLIALALNGGWRAMGMNLGDQFRRFLFEAPMVVLVNFAIASRIYIEQNSKSSTIYWLMRRLFFTAKTVLTLSLAFVLSADACHPVNAVSPISADLLQTFLFTVMALVGLRWVFRDQEQRCKQCLRSLTTPAQVGRPSHNLLEWSGTEMICKRGHGRLTVPRWRRVGAKPASGWPWLRLTVSCRRTVGRLLLLCAISLPAVAALASEYHGQVTFGGLPLPGSTVTVTATQGNKKAVAITDDQGLFSFTDLTDGTWMLDIEMTGFAPLKQEVTIAPDAASATFELKLLTLDQIRAQDKPVKADATELARARSAAPVSAPAPATAAGGGKGGAANAKVAAATKAQITAGDTSTAGNTPTAPMDASAAQDATSQQANDGYLINGSVNNAATSQYSMNQAFGNNRNGRSLYNGSAFLRLDNSALDAAPFSVTGTPVAKPQFNNFTLGLNYGGPLNIPHLMPRGPYFGVNYTRTQNSSFATQPALIPTGEDGEGNWILSSATVPSINVPADLATVAPACDSYLLSMGMTQAQIASGTAQFANNIIPAQCVASASNILLRLYPQTPNLTGSKQYNYQLPLNTGSHVDTLGISIQKQLGNKNNLNGRWNFSDTRGSNPSIFGFLDSTATLGMNTSVNWNHRFTQRFSGTLGYQFSRQRSQLIPNFANKNDIQAMAGISGASTAPEYWGPPTLGFSSGITSLTDGVFSYNRNETNGVSLSMSWNHMYHNVQFGGAFRRQEFNYLTQSNPYGSLGFTGAATRSSAGVGGSDLADFLLGIPDTSQIAYGNADKYLRNSAYALYVTDDFRVNPEFTINAGLRWEYGAPVTELKGRLVNLDITPGFTQETYVEASNPKGALTGQVYPSSLVHPDYSRPEPRIGIAWRPISGSSLLIRSGYDVTNDTSVYQSAAYAMAQQFPLSTSESIANSVACPFSIASPFAAPSCSATSPDTFAIDPNFRVGYVQTWNLSVQRDLPLSLQMVATYLGTKGTRGVQEYLPNSCPPGTSAPCTAAPSGYVYRASNGNLTREAGSIELRRRLRNGLQARLLYTFSKSMDDDYSLSGQGSVANGAIAQNWQDLSGQRGLSITDQRNVLNVTAQYTTGMGIGGKTLMTGWKGALYKEWTVLAAIAAASGLPETPIYGGAIASGTGVTGTVRPNLVGSPYANLAAGYFLNAAAYAAPVGAWGTARRDSIAGPDQVTLNAAMNRTFRLHDRYMLDAQFNATNVLNHVVYSGWNTTWIIGSTTFGAPTGANAMRSMSVGLRMRF